jgi:ketosteroid isomerase-like protein
VALTAGGGGDAASATERIQLARDMYAAFAAGDRDTVERILAEDFAFHAPPDPQLDRAGYFKRCWPGAGKGQSFEFVRLVESGDEVIVTYVSSRADGSRFRNTEVLRFTGDQIREVEVYFGWNLD